MNTQDKDKTGIGRRGMLNMVIFYADNGVSISKKLL
jgi:hypothetical protein